jgi:hypothetical protein
VGVNVGGIVAVVVGARVEVGVAGTAGVPQEANSKTKAIITVRADFCFILDSPFIRPLAKVS